jgi:hypothetical protein
MSDHGFWFVNLGQIDKWGNAYRPEGVRWEGTIHRAGCSYLGDQVVRFTPEQITATGVQTCIPCGGDGKPVNVVAVEDGYGCPDWERERSHEPHRFRDRVDGSRHSCPGWAS